MSATQYSFSVNDRGVISSIVHGSDRFCGRLTTPGSVWGVTLTNSEWDLIHVARSLLSIDRVARRNQTGARRQHDAWKRELSVEIAVCCPERWTAATPILIELLEFMTDDLWELSFISNGGRSIQQPLPIPSGRPPAEVALFSGGLDSAAGLLARGAHSTGTILAVTAVGNQIRRDNQRRAIERLRAQGVACSWAPIDSSLRECPLGRKQKEITQRSRGLLFLAMGAATASAVRVDNFQIYESGVGCINVPFCRAQVGAQATKAMHPRTLNLFNKVSATVLPSSPQVRAPFFLHTKGELCSAARDGLHELLRVASSCDEGDGHKKNAMEHCGLCTSCIFRRISVHAADACQDPTVYRDTASKNHGEYELSLFEGLAAELRAHPSFQELVSLDPDVRFAVDAPMTTSTTEDLRTGVADLFQRYAGEIESFLSRSRPTIPAPVHRLQARRTTNDLFSAAR